MTDGEEKDMGFLDHLEELRWRLVKSVIAVFVVAVAAFLSKELIFDGIILAPKNSDFITYRLFCQLGQYLGLSEKLCMTDFRFSLQNITMAGQFSTHMSVSLITGLIVAFPYVFYQLWGFIKPGLREKEQKMASGIVFYASALFLLGILFGYFVLAPLSVQFLGTYRVSAEVENQIGLNSFISTVTTVTLATGAVFQLPIVIYFLAKIGLVSPQFLKKYWRHAFVVVLVIAAIITPPDVFSQILVTLPLMLLYILSIYIAARVTKAQSRKN